MIRKRDNVVPFRKPVRAVPLRKLANRPHRSPRSSPVRRGLELIAKWRLRLLVGAFFLLVAADSFRGGALAHQQWLPWAQQPTEQDPEAAWFQLCVGPVRYTCVVDGDTIWYRGERIRLLGIDAPEVFSPGCAREEELGRRATIALRDILNEGPFSLGRHGLEPDRDAYDRLLRRATREGEPIAERLIWQGLAHRYRAAGPGWCE